MNTLIRSQARKYYREPILDLLRQHVAKPDSLVDYIERSWPRIEYTIEYLREQNIQGKRICEIGFGAIGIACSMELGAKIDAYDIDDTYVKLCGSLNIPFQRINLENAIPPPSTALRYDMVVFCEVIEHINRSPEEILKELREWVVPGGHLLLSTPNLARLSNRFRLLAGKELFARYGTENFTMGHQREYTLSEIEHYLLSAGYEIEDGPFYFAQPDLRFPLPFRAGYICITRIMPSMSNLMFALAKNPL